VIENAANGKDLVACVAMDYSVVPKDVNDGKRFTRFFIFGPSGELLPSVNLDGLGEKFIPGACVACHGGNNYAGKFPVDGITGKADLGAHFLPFDIGNFEFSRKPGFTQVDQEEAIYQLNQNVLQTNANQAEIELIQGRYKTGHIQDPDFVPSNLTPDQQDFYRKVIARSCRTCHIAQRDRDSIKDLTFSKLGVNLVKPVPLDPPDLAELVCGQTDDLLRAYAMPNSAVTFNLFWLSPQTLNDQLQQFHAKTGIVCKNPKLP
jgi:hypothetical protein